MRTSASIRRLTMAVTALTALAIVSACEGPTGPEGPQGPTGLQGDPGPVGNANVISGSTTLAESDWSSNIYQVALGTSPNVISYSQPWRYADIAVAAITSDVVADGAVLAFIQADPTFNPTVFSPLPYEFNHLLSTIVRIYDFQVTEGQIRILHRIDDQNSSSDPDPLAVPQTTRDYRWVIIPPAAAQQLSTLPVALGPDAVLEHLARRGFEVVSFR